VTAIDVHLDTEEGRVAVGTATVTRLRGATSTQFTYDGHYLAGPGWAISPDLPIARRDTILRGLPGAIDDSAPDTWGRNLITRRLASRARAAGHDAPTPTEVDFLLGVNDLTRQGALRYAVGDGDFLAQGPGVPKLLALDKLLEATKQVTANTHEDLDAVEALLDAGSGSLGGARPKASVTDADRLLVAKFPHHDDQWDVMAWEGVALDLAEACGLTTPPHETLTIGTDTVLLVERFDRAGSHRVPYLSARSLIGGPDGTAADYLELVEAVTEHGSEVNVDLLELWLRIAFSIVVNNTDDHMRNHAFLRSRNGWKLSPIFDVNPNPDPMAARSTGIQGAITPSECRDALFTTADRFNVSPTVASQSWSEIVDVVRGWRAVATDRRIPESECARFAAALDRWVT
jgi:serine/threonine-protein kinase HipA